MRPLAVNAEGLHFFALKSKCIAVDNGASSDIMETYNNEEVYQQ
jgi:hypothetical protein